MVQTRNFYGSYPLHHSSWGRASHNLYLLQPYTRWCFHCWLPLAVLSFCPVSSLYIHLLALLLFWWISYHHRNPKQVFLYSDPFRYLSICFLSRPEWLRFRIGIQVPARTLFLSSWGPMSQRAKYSLYPLFRRALISQGYITVFPLFSNRSNSSQWPPPAHDHRSPFGNQRRWRGLELRFTIVGYCMCFDQF